MVALDPQQVLRCYYTYSLFYHIITIRILKLSSKSKLIFIFLFDQFYLKYCTIIPIVLCSFYVFVYFHKIHFFLNTSILFNGFFIIIFSYTPFWRTKSLSSRNKVFSLNRRSVYAHNLYSFRTI